MTNLTSQEMQRRKVNGLRGKMAWKEEITSHFLQEGKLSGGKIKTSPLQDRNSRVRKYG